MKFGLNTITRTISRQVLVARKNSPHIFFVGGVIGVVGSTVLACRATLKLDENLDEIRKEFQQVKDLDTYARENSPKYTEQMYYKELGRVYTKSAIKLGRLYGPALVVGVASIGALTGSHVQMTRRNTALTFTLAAVSKAYEDYRLRIQEEIGADRELEIHRAIKNEKVDVDGKKELVKIMGENGCSPYGRFFDSNNPNWTGNQEYNRIFIQAQQNYANHLLHARGHVFLNDVYDNLGFERSTPGAVVGWVLDGEGDGYIDFGLTEAWNKQDHSMSFILDFNVDGVVYDKI